MRFVKPLDEALVRAMAASHDLIVTLEENAIMGGAGSAVLECISASSILCHVLILGIPDHYIEHDTPSRQWRACGLDQAGILKAVRQRLASQA